MLPAAASAYCVAAAVLLPGYVRFSDPASVGLPTQPAGNTVFVLAVADLDQDGHEDVVSWTGPVSPAVNAQRGTGTGSFGLASVRTTGSATAQNPRPRQ